MESNQVTEYWVSLFPDCTAENFGPSIPQALATWFTGAKRSPDLLKTSGVTGASPPLVIASRLFCMTTIG